MQRPTKARTRPAYPTFIKTLDGVVSQGHEELGGSVGIKGQSSRGLPCFLHQMEPVRKDLVEKQFQVDLLRHLRL